MKKIDFKKKLKHLYWPSAKQVEMVEVPSMNYLMIDGQGDPNRSQDYKDAIGALYPISYALKFMAKKGDLAIDYGVLPLECLWWVDDMHTFSVTNKADWKWTLMMMQPDFLTGKMVQNAIDQVGAKKNPPALPMVRFEAFSEETVAQIMHIGPFSEEGPTIEKVHAFIDQSGYQNTGKHHEIYLSDIRRAAPQKWKTIIRQPIALKQG